MKKTLFFAAFAALLSLASCQKENIENEVVNKGVTRFTATIEQTKTAIDSDGEKVTWCEGDSIKVTDASSNTAVFIAESAGASTTFNIKDGESPLGDGPYTASYGDINNQVYDASGANCPLTAPATETTNFIFSSPYAVVKFTVKSEDEVTVNKVEVTYNNVTYTLDCEVGVDLTPSGKDFYVAVAPSDTAALSVAFQNTSFYKATKTRKTSVALAAGDLLPVTFTLAATDFDTMCIAAGTMITMGNGSQKAVEELEIGDVIRTVDHETGEVSSSPVCFIWESKDAANAFTLTFEGGIEVTVVEEHGFYDQEKRAYAFINADNAGDYIGHHFYDADNGSWLELTGYEKYDGRIDAYAVATSRHLDHLSNGILSMSDGSFKVLANLFEYDDQLKYDAAKKQADIEKYGLTPIEKVLELEGFTETDYYDYNLQYLDIAVGKGFTTWEWVKALSDYCVANGL